MKKTQILAGLILASTAGSYGQTTTQKPNILWLTCEDNNVSWVGCYGNPQAETPNIDKLASEGFQYMHAYANAPVCAPSRSTWITGIHALSMGTHPMRSRYNIPHSFIRYYPDCLRDNGYYTGNDKKTDYNIGGRSDKDCWDNKGKVDWNALKNNQPFFQVINAEESHESRAQGDVENTIHDPADVKLRSYHPDVPDVRKNYAKYYDAMKRMDAQIGASLKKLEEMGLAENTIVIHNSDHGGVLPRSKRFLFESGLHCPLIIRIPEKYKDLWPADAPGSKVDRLVSFIDMPKTWLSITGSDVPETMQGQIFMGPDTDSERNFHFAFRGRMDERLDNARAVLDKRFLYIRNYMPYAPWMQHQGYLWKMKATQAWENHVLSGKADEVESRFFAPKGWTEELYDMSKDPDSVNNLIHNPEYAEVAARMRAALRQWQKGVSDAGLMPESEVVKRAKENNTTIYDLVRDSKLYNLPALLDAADLALEEAPNNLPQLRALLKSPDCGLRYWGLVGCFLLNDASVTNAAMKDESHEIRAMAAWLAVKTGSKKAGLACLDDLLKNKSYATLSVLNILDWMGDDAKPLLDRVAGLPAEKYETRMKDNLMSKYGLNE